MPNQRQPCGASLYSSDCAEIIGEEHRPVQKTAGPFDDGVADRRRIKIVASARKPRTDSVIEI
ncbi:MAG: hypothetical protein ACLT3W_06260 [Bifidobacterium pseudocatenulatum]